MKKMFFMFFMLSVCTISVFCQVAAPDYTDLALGLAAKYPWFGVVGYALWVVSEYLGKAKWTKANGVLQFIFGLFFKRKQMFGNADLGGNKPPKV